MSNTTTMKYPEFYYARENELKDKKLRSTNLANVVTLNDGSFKQKYFNWSSPVVLRAFRIN